MQNLVCKWVNIFKIFSFWIIIHLRKCWNNWDDLARNESLFLAELMFVQVFIQILWRHIHTKTKLEYPCTFPHPSLVGSFKEMVYYQGAALQAGGG